GPQRDGVRELGEREAVDRLTVHVHAAVESDLHLSLRGDDDRSAAATDQAITVLRGEKSVLIAYERAVAGVAQRAGAGAEREEPGAGDRDVEVVAGRGERALLEDRRRVVDLRAAADRTDRLLRRNAGEAFVRHAPGIDLEAEQLALRLRLHLQQRAFEARRIDVGEVVGDRIDRRLRDERSRRRR